MNVLPAVLCLAACLLLPACAPITTMVLMPDESGKVGTITVNTSGQVNVLDKAYDRLTVSDGLTSRAKTSAMSEAQVYQDYHQLIKAQPLPSLTFMVYFDRGSADLVERTKALIPSIIDGIRSRVPTEIAIIGHTDTTGSEAINAKLSLERAQAVEKTLREGIPSKDGVKMHSFGSKGLIVPTSPNIDEPRNRAVEILIL